MTDKAKTVKRSAQLCRDTKETHIKLFVDLDPDKTERQVTVDSGIGFFDHMLELFGYHSRFGFELECKGDTKVDGHHSVEDVGIALGKALAQAVGDKKGIARYATVTIPMDEALATVSVDISGRPYLVFNADFSCDKVGDFDLELIEEFFRAVATYGGITLHINLHYGFNNHHKAEAVFKAFARAIAKAVEIVSDEVPSSKGMLE